MRYYLTIFAIILFACKRKNQTPQEVEVVDLVSTPKEHAEITILICDEDRRDSALYQEFISENEISYKNELDNKFYYNTNKKDVDSLLMMSQVECVTPLSGGQYSIYDIQYKDQVAKDVYETILNMNKKKEGLNEYHDYFKRGMVFILNKESNKLTVLSFNPFADNKLPAKIKAYFKANRKEYHRVFSLIGLGQVDTLVDEH